MVYCYLCERDEESGLPAWIGADRPAARRVSAFDLFRANQRIQGVTDDGQIQRLWTERQGQKAAKKTRAIKPAARPVAKKIRKRG